MTTAVEHFLAHLDRLTGVTQQQMSLLRSSTPGMSNVLILTYPDQPRPGTHLGVTWGLSEAGGIELVTAVASSSHGWVLSVAQLGESLRGEIGDRGFLRGDVLTHGEPLSEGSTFDAFLLIPAEVLGQEWSAELAVAADSAEAGGPEDEHCVDEQGNKPTGCDGQGGCGGGGGCGHHDEPERPDTVRLLFAAPIHASEREALITRGFEAFWQEHGAVLTLADWTNLDRPALV